MKSSAEIYIDKLTELFGKENTIRRVEANDGGPAIYVFYYKDLPDEGCLTAITYGLSIENNPNWKFGKPELIVSLDTTKVDWGLAAGYIAAQLRGKSDFCYGETYKIKEPISTDSKMEGYFTFVPSFLQKEEYTIPLPDKTVILTGL